MTNPTVDRKLAALLFSDIKGYSSQMDRDEEGALRRLAIHNAIFDLQVDRHSGRTVKTVGDAYMIEFASAVNAVRCGLDVQRALGVHNASNIEDEQIWVRMGVHFGDVIIKGDDLFGETVNIAARLEPKAPPGALCISQAVFNQVRRKVEATGQDMGQVSLKNINEPFQLYALTPSTETLDLVGKLAKVQSRALATSADPKRSAVAMSVGGILALLMGVAIWYLGFGPGSAAKEPPATPEVVNKVQPKPGADAGAAVGRVQPVGPEVPSRGGVLRLGVEGERTTVFDLMSRIRSVNSQVLSMVYDSLIRFDPEADALVPGVIERWELSADATKLTLHLRKGVWFHPHKCFAGGKARMATSRDVAFTIAQGRKADPSLPVKGLADFLAGKADRLEGVVIQDDGSVTLTLDKPTAFAVHNVANDRFYPHELRTCGDMTSMAKPPGSGPFRVADAKPGFHFRLDAWDRYWDKAPDGKPYPYLEAVDISVVSDTITSVSRLAKSALDAVEVPEDAATQLLDNIKTDRPTLKKRFPSSTLSVSAAYPPPSKQVLQAVFFLPTDKSPLLNRDVRRALGTALDKQALASVFTAELSATARFLNPDSEGYHEGLRGIAHDLEAAKGLLVEAGLPKGIAEFSFGHYPELRQVAERVRAQLAKIGVKVRLVALGPKAMSNAIRKHSVDAFLARWLSSNTNQEPYPYLTGIAGFTGSIGWKDAELPGLIQTIMSEPKRAKRSDAYRRLEKRLVEQAFILPIAWPAKRRPNAFWLTRPTVRGLVDKFTGRVRLTSGTQLQYVWVKAP